jgi:hypothetical protein
MKLIKTIYLLSIMQVSIAVQVCSGQIVLPTMQPSSYVQLNINTISVSEITKNAAKVYGSLSASSGNTATKGVCYDVNIDPTISNSLVYSNNGPGNYTVSLTGLSSNTNYYSRAFVTINGNTTYGKNLTFLTAKNNGFTTDNNLNYVTMYTPGGQYANSEAQMDQQTQPGYNNIISSGVASIGVITNFTNYNTLTSAGINVTSNGDNFSIVATGFFVTLETGAYTFTCEGDDAVDLFINNVNIVGNYGGHAVAGLGSHTGTINLTAGTKYSVRVRMQEYAGQEALMLYWRKPSQTSSWYQNTGEMSSY